MKTFASQRASLTPIRHSFCSRMTMTFALMFVMMGLAQAAPPTDITCGSNGYTIDSPGQYRLIADCLVPPNTNGITITPQGGDADLNLNGHTIRGLVRTGRDCPGESVGISVGASNVHIDNGTVMGFVLGIQIGGGLNNIQVNGLTLTGNCIGIIGSSNNIHIEGNTVSGNFLGGIRLAGPGRGNRVNSNVVIGNGGQAVDVGGVPVGGDAGIQLTDGTSGNVITDNYIAGNNGGVRLISSNDNTIQDNTVNDNNITVDNIVRGEFGIRLDAQLNGNPPSIRNVVQNNRALGQEADLVDLNPPQNMVCVNRWTKNIFQTVGQGAGAGCIQ